MPSCREHPCHGGLVSSAMPKCGAGDRGGRDHLLRNHEPATSGQAPGFFPRSSLATSHYLRTSLHRQRRLRRHCCSSVISCCQNHKSTYHIRPKNIHTSPLVSSKAPNPTMGALLSIPLMALPSAGTVSCLATRRAARPSFRLLPFD